MKILFTFAFLTISTVALGAKAWDVKDTVTVHGEYPGDACEAAEAQATANCRSQCGKSAIFEIDPKAKTCVCDSAHDSTCIITVKGTCISN
jgi:hypothetical protein